VIVHVLLYEVVLLSDMKLCRLNWISAVSLGKCG